jgi:RND family efflux transporter MFP subunit
VKILRWVLLGLVGLAAALLTWFLWPQARAVEIARVERKSLTQALDEDGLVRSWVEVAVASQVQGRLARIHQARGQRVKTGQLLAELDSGEQQAALDQLLAQERAALQSVQQARSQLGLTRQRVEADMDVARAGVRLAQAQRDKVLVGPRVEQRRVVRAIYQRARLRLQESARDTKRRKQLYEQGAVSRADLENYESAYHTALYNLREAESRWHEVERGAIVQERQVATAEVERSAASLRATQAQQLQAEVAAASLGEAEQRLQSVRAQVRQAEVRLQQTQLRSPAEGTLEWEEIEPGEIVTPGQTVLRICDPQKIYVELLLDEGDRAQARLGSLVHVTCDAYPGQTFDGKLQAIEAQAFLKRQLRNSPTQDEDRVFRARVSLEQEGVGKLFPGMSVFAQVVLAERGQVLTIPRQACINREGQWVVFVEQGGVARRRVIEVGQKDNLQLEVVAGLAEGDRVLLNPGSMADGARVRVSSP